MSRKKPETLLGMRIKAPAVKCQDGAAVAVIDLESLELDKPNAWLTGAQAKRMLDMSQAQFSRLTQDPAFGFVRTFRPREGAHVRYSRADIQRFLMSRISTVAEAV